MHPRHRVALFRLIGAILEALPERVDVGVAQALGERLGRRSASRERLARNISRVLTGDGGSPSPELIDRYVRRAFRSYAQYWAESAKLPALAASTITSRFRIAEGLEHLEEAHARGAGVVIALPHVGSWEWGGAVIASLGMPMTAVAEELSPPALFEWFRAKREAIGIHVQGLNAEASTKLLSVLRSGGVVGLLCDRDIGGGGVEVDFFSSRVTLPAGPATLALRSGATLLAAACYAGPGRDHFAVITRPLEVGRQGRLRDDVTRVTQAIAGELEGLIRRAPEQWHVLEDRFGAVAG
jgi:phosphatidylinositol dimannoside acyltransferase